MATEEATPEPKPLLVQPFEGTAAVMGLDAGHTRSSWSSTTGICAAGQRTTRPTASGELARFDDRAALLSLLPSWRVRLVVVSVARAQREDAALNISDQSVNCAQQRVLWRAVGPAFENRPLVAQQAERVVVNFHPFSPLPSGSP